MTDGVVDVIVYPSSTDKTRNRGFAFVEYESHKGAAMARRKLIPGTAWPALSADRVSSCVCPAEGGGAQITAAESEGVGGGTGGLIMSRLSWLFLNVCPAVLVNTH